MDTRCEIIIADDPQHEKVFAEIHYGDKFLALISQEEGLDRLKVELPGAGLDERQIVRQIGLVDFVAVLEEAAKKLAGKS